MFRSRRLLYLASIVLGLFVGGGNEAFPQAQGGAAAKVKLTPFCHLVTHAGKFDRQILL